MANEWHKQRDIDRVEVEVSPAEEITIGEILDREFRSKLQHTASANLPENPDANSEDEYRKILPEYSQGTGNATDVENQPHIEHGKFDFEIGSIGWKLHLNVPAAHVAAVAQYLKGNGYIHKYLTGGEPKDGKVFTLYIGSQALAKKLSSLLAKDLAAWLVKPAARSEIELAPGVVGRFEAHTKGFSKYGVSGFSLLEEDKKRLTWQNPVDEAARAKAEVRAFKALKEKYGDYFYQPEA